MNTGGQTDPVADFEPRRARLLGLAYRMLGSMAEAEDAVQETYLRWHRCKRTLVTEPAAFLTRTLTRICLDVLKSARVQREHYVGPWLPDPILEAAALGTGSDNDYADDLSVALLLTLERLTPLERAAFLLHDVFDQDYAAIADALGRSEAACRQLAARARRHVRHDRPRFRPSADQAERLTLAFVSALGSGDIGALGALLTQDAVLYSDGGGKVPAAGKPVTGVERIALFLTGIARKPVLRQRLINGPVRLERAEVNGMPGLLFYLAGELHQTYALELRADRIAAIYVTRNPDKLARLRH